MTSVLRSLALAPVALLLAATGSTAAALPTAEALPTAAAGTPGYCPGDTGVTVVVDFTALGGDVVVRCAPGATGDGVDALTGAGFDVEGTAQWGTAFVCRLEGRPAADEQLAVQGDPDYTEACQTTPPTRASWAYSYSPDSGSWHYSSAGARSHQAIEGGFEGWRFTLNGSARTPSLAPRRPGSTGDDEEADEEPTRDRERPRDGERERDRERERQRNDESTNEPTDDLTDGPTDDPTDDPTDVDSEEPRREGDRDGQGRGDRSRHDGKPGKPGKPQDRPSDEPAGQSDELGTTAQGATVTGELPEEPAAGADDDGSATSSLVAAGVVILLGAGAGTTAWRRRSRRT